MKRVLFALGALFAAVSMSMAAIDVNKASAAELDSIKGIGPAMSKKILDERAKGSFKDWSDFETRVKGVGEKSTIKLSSAGLTVNGKALDNALAVIKADAKRVKTETKAAAAAKLETKAVADVKTADAKPAAEEVKPTTMIDAKTDLKAKLDAAKKAKLEAKAKAAEEKKAKLDAAKKTAAPIAAAVKTDATTTDKATDKVVDKK